MTEEFEFAKEVYQIHRGLSDCRQPHYIALIRNQVAAEGRTLDEVRKLVTHLSGPCVEPEFIVMEE